MTMKTNLLVSMLPLVALSACNQPSEPANNMVWEINVQALDQGNLVDGEVGANGAEIAPIAPPVPVVEPAPPQPPVVKARPPVTPPKPKTPPPIATDPHAGHDMANMANHQ